MAAMTDYDMRRLPVGSWAVVGMGEGEPDEALRTAADDAGYELVSVPAAIEAGLCPGGLVARVYLLDGTLQLESRYATLDEATESARATAYATSAAHLLATYDGDDGLLLALAAVGAAVLDA